MPDEPPHFAVLTPPGRGAIATVVVRGCDAILVVSRRFQSIAGRPLAAFPTGRVLFGRFRTAGSTSEDLVVGLVAENEVEIHCHGGTAAVAAIGNALIDDGCAQLTAEQWAHNRQSDAIAAQALLAVADARTERAAAILLDQYRGALRAELTAIVAALTENSTASAAAAMEALLARANLGLHLTDPWKVVIAGRPNAGKSSLMNVLLGYQRSIVWKEPGTTRDVLASTTAFDGWPVELTDTAGLRGSDDPIESAGVTRAMQQAATADLLLLVADTTSPWDDELELMARQSTTLVVNNKCDLTGPPTDRRPAGISTSALTGAGIEELCNAIASTLARTPPPPGFPVPFAHAQVAALQSAAAALAIGNIASAGQHLQSLLDYNCQRGS